MMNLSKLFLDGREAELCQLRFCFHSGSEAQQRKQANTDFSTQSSDLSTAQGTDSQFEGPVQQSPFYKALLTTGTEGTSSAYGNAESNIRRNANASGFGYNQPVAQGAEDQVQAQEAGAMANLPAEAAEEAAPLALSAAQQTGGMGMGVGGLGNALLNTNTSNFAKNVNQGVQTGGQIGSAAISAFCPARGSLYLMAYGSHKPVEELKVGEMSLSLDGEPEAIDEIQVVREPILLVTTENGLKLRNSETHCYVMRDGGFTLAAESLGKQIRTHDVYSKVVSVEPAGEDDVFDIRTPSHTYRADGAWALGVGHAESDEACKRYLEQKGQR